MISLTRLAVVLSLGIIVWHTCSAQSLPVAHYSFDEIGEPGRDSVGSFDAVSVVNVDQVQGVVGLAGRFTSGYMQLPDDSALDLLSGDFTLSLWLRSDSFTSGNWFTKATSTTHKYGMGGPRGVFDGSGQASGYASFFFNGSSAFGGVQTSVVVFDGEWHHIAAVKRGLTAEIWVDGVRQLRPPGPVNWNDVINPAFTDDGAFAIGRAGLCCESFIGEIDEAKIWDRALLPGEIEREAQLCGYGPEDQPIVFTKGRGKPVLEEFRWSSCGGSGTLLVQNGAAKSAFFFLNGSLILSPADFSDEVVTLERLVDLVEGFNVIQVELRGRPGSSIAVSFTEE